MHRKNRVEVKQTQPLLSLLRRSAGLARLRLSPTDTQSHPKRLFLRAGYVTLALLGALFFLNAPSVSAKSPQSIGARITWVQLNPQQQAVLAPLAKEWDSLPEINRQKWMEIAGRYPKLSPEAQQRLQSRMTDWAKMTPEQRRTARENYQTSKSVSKDKRVEAWQNYQKLSVEQKNKLAAQEKAQKKPSVVTAPPSVNAKFTKDANKVVRHQKNKTKNSVTPPANKGASLVPMTTQVAAPAQ